MKWKEFAFFCIDKRLMRTNSCQLNPFVWTCALIVRMRNDDWRWKLMSNCDINHLSRSNKESFTIPRRRWMKIAKLTRACLISRLTCEILEKQVGNDEFFRWIEAATSSTSHQTLVGRVGRRLNIFLGHDATPCPTSPARLSQVIETMTE